MNSKKFKCYAKNLLHKYEAPYIVVSAHDKEAALREFEQLTRLADFENEWSLHAYQINK